MTRLQITKTSFTSGEIDPEMYGRIELRAFEEGAAKLRNVLVQPTGGVSRRPGTLFLGEAPNARRLIPFDTPNGEHLMIIGTADIAIWDTDGIVQNGLAPIWSEAQLQQLTWSRLDQSILLCHPDVQPQKLKQNSSGNWSIGAWEFDTAEGENGSFTAQPYAKLADNHIAVQPTNLNVAAPDEHDPIPVGADIEILATDNLFVSDHFGTIFRIKGREVRIQTVLSPVKARAITLQELADGKTTRFFDEQVYSEARGWPAAIAQHQDRLVMAGNRGAADQIWFSQTGRYGNFDLGIGLADEAIGFRLGDTRLHQIRQMASGRRLQVLTNLGEWVVSGSPLTPTNITVDLQTTVGSPTDRQVRPLDVDGATLFAGASLRDVREFIFADSEQAFQSPDIALLSRHLLKGVREFSFVPRLRIFAVVLDDGALATATIDRNANVIAWSLQEFDGDVRAAAMFNHSLHLLLDSGGKTLLLSMDDTVALDLAVQGESPSAQSLWPGFEHMVGELVRVKANGADLGELPVTSDILDIGTPALAIEAGLAFTHEIEPLPVSGIGRNSPLDTLYRPIRSVFRILDTPALKVSTKSGERTLLESGEAHSGDFSLRDSGWRRGQGQFLWRISQSDPQPFTLLSATTEVKVNN